MTKYERFFTLGSFVLAPELLSKRDTVNQTFAFCQAGLALDDMWDFMPNRKNRIGTYLSSSEFESITAGSQEKHKFEIASSRYSKLTESHPDKRRRIHNFNCFIDSINLVESMALAVPQQPDKWSPYLVETYRYLDVVLWASMYTSLIPGSDLWLLKPDNQLYDLAKSNPITGLTTVLNEYSILIAQNDKQRNRLLNMANQMTYIQTVMDNRDQKINQALGSPSYTTDLDTDPIPGWDSISRGKIHLEKSREYPGHIVPIALINLFGPVYRIATDKTWRDNKVWEAVASY